MNTDAFTTAARAEAEQYTPTDEEVRTDYVTAYADRDSSQLLAGMAFDRWLAKRDEIIRRQERYIEELESGRITPRDHLARQEVTEAEVEAADRGRVEHNIRRKLTDAEWAATRSSIEHESMRAALTAAKEARA